MLRPEPPYQRIFFDCDSTLARIEGIDELARRAGLYEALAPLSAQAMDGRIALESIFHDRLERLRPDRATLEWLGQLYIDCIVPGAAETIRCLRALAKPVHIVSAGLKPAVLKLADLIGIPADQVHAVDVRFDAAGRYAGYDQQSPLTRRGGKRVCCEHLLQQGESGVIVGDGITDQEAECPRIAFIGYGGVVHRAPVAAKARVYVDTPDLRAVLPMLLAPEEYRLCEPL